MIPMPLSIVVIAPFVPMSVAVPIAVAVAERYDATVDRDADKEFAKSKKSPAG
jgi:hypothetical protein